MKKIIIKLVFDTKPSDNKCISLEDFIGVIKCQNYNFCTHNVSIPSRMILSELDSIMNEICNDLSIKNDNQNIKYSRGKIDFGESINDNDIAINRAEYYIE